MFVIIFILIILLAGCDISKQYELEVKMPELPEHIKECYGDIKFELKYPGLSMGQAALSPGQVCYTGELQSPKVGSRYLRSLGQAPVYADLAPGSSVFITASVSIFPVVATPYIYLESDNSTKKEYIPCYPAGGIFPESGKDSALLLKWEDGFAAEIIYRMVNNGYNLESFNLGRFKNYLLEKSEGNPWIFDEENIVYALSFDIFNANFVKKKNTRTIALQIPFGTSGGKGWRLSNLIDPRFFEEDNGMIILGDIPERNVFILSDTGKEYAQLFIDSAGWYAYFSNSTKILSGRW